MGLDFGLIYEVVVDPPTRQNETAVFGALVEQVKTADRVGFHSVWHVEHHFLKGFSHSTNNDVLLGAYAAATERIRIGYGVKLLPFNFNHPVRAAEAVATLDQISGGRCEFGTGRGISRDELEGMAVDPHRTRDEWRESLDMIVKCWEDEQFSWNSDRFQIPPRDVIPKPVQQPHPPLWMAGTSYDSHTLAGELGLGLLSFQLLTPLDDLAHRIELYRQGIARCTDPIGKFVNDRAAAFTPVYCGESDEEAREVAGRAVEKYVLDTLEIVGRMATWVAGKDIPSLQYLQKTTSVDLSQVNFDFLLANDMCVVGDPDTCIGKLKKYQELGIDLFLGNFQGAGVPLDKVQASIERFGREVIPAFH